MANPRRRSRSKSSEKVIGVGYCHLDRAVIYGNEASVGKVVTESSAPREELFATVQINYTQQVRENTNAFGFVLSNEEMQYLNLSKIMVI